MTDAIQLIPTDQINAEALPRDRSVLDPAALTELQRSISTSGLRLPIELFPTEGGYGLISGYRRLAAFRALEAARGDGRFAAIPAVLHPAEALATAFARVIEENDIRAGLSAWERGRTLIVARDLAGLTGFDAALDALYPHANRRKRLRIRMLAEVVEAFDGQIDAPERWSENRLLRLGQLLRYGWDELIATALEGAVPGSEWQAILPIIAEAESLSPSARKKPNRPRRLVRLPRDLTPRRERTAKGYLLHITGRQATDALVGEVIDEIERIFGG